MNPLVNSKGLVSVRLPKKKGTKILRLFNNAYLFFVNFIKGPHQPSVSVMTSDQSI